MISIDASILEPDSASFRRMADYGSICEELHILVLNGKGNRVKISENVFAYSVGTNFRFMAVFRAIRASKKILSGAGKWIITTQDPFETGFIGWRLAKKFKVPLEIQMHGDFYGNKYWKKENCINFFRFYLGKFILRRATSVRAVSERIKKSIEFFLKKDTKIFKNPILSEEKKQIVGENNLRKKYPNNFPIILAVGNLVPVKNHKMLIEVFSEIKKDFPEAKLIIVGDGHLLKSLQLTALSFKLENDVELAGHKDNLSDYYSSADIFIHPSLNEGWGRAVVEAATFGLPIIMSDVGLAGELIKNNESGLVVPVNDKEALKDAIVKLAKDGAQRDRLGVNAKLAVLELLHKEEYLNEIKEAWSAI